MLEYVRGGNDDYYRHICENRTAKWNRERPEILTFDISSFIKIAGVGTRIDYCPFCGVKLDSEDKDIPRF